MLCDECKKNQATYHTIKKINGITSERHLCYECHIKEAEKNIAFTSAGELFSGFKDLFYQKPQRSTYRCSVCGTSADEFLETGFVGCPNCYKDLSAVIMPVVSKVQSNDTRHVGKSPYGGGEEDDASIQYASLQRELQKAVEEERYEDASIIRDKMRALRGEK